MRMKRIIYRVLSTNCNEYLYTASTPNNMPSKLYVNLYIYA
nr:MAG TPA: hypothetical protein [Caudoviricetes sp.]